MALSCRDGARRSRQLSGVKRTSQPINEMSAFDPNRKSRGPLCCDAQQHRFDVHDADIVDSQKATASGVKELPTMTISFSLAPRVALADAIAQIHDMEIRLALPATITTFLAKAE